MQVVDAALKARTKLGDDEKWASALTERLTLELDLEIIKDIKFCGADRHYKRTMTNIILDYLGEMRKFIIESIWEQCESLLSSPHKSVRSLEIE